MHERQAIRDALVAALTGKTPAGTNVFKTRVEPFRQAQLPAVHLYIDSESVEEESATTAPRELKRTAIVGIDGWLAVEPDLDDRLDDFALAIEAALDADPWLNETASAVILSSTEMGLSVQGDRKLGCVHLEFAVTYFSPVRTGAPADIFDTAGITTVVGEQQPETVKTDIHQGGGN